MDILEPPLKWGKAIELGLSAWSHTLGVVVSIPPPYFDIGMTPFALGFLIWFVGVGSEGLGFGEEEDWTSKLVDPPVATLD